jgi:hypothetical protein
MATSEGNFRRTARAYLAAIDKYNGKTNAILTKLEELAMEQAARADEAENEANGWGCSTVSASRSRTAYTWCCGMPIQLPACFTLRRAVPF